MSLLFPDEVRAAATISDCGRYRYDLRRTWGDESRDGVVNFVMLNPSTADANLDDPTIRRCLGFAKSWGFGGLVVTNLYAFRATDPRDLPMTGDPVGPLNDETIGRWAASSPAVVCAWGSKSGTAGRAKRVTNIIRQAGRVPSAIRLTKGGCPAHPLYLPGDLRPVPFGFAS